MKNEESGEKQHYTRSPIWWLGLALMALGEMGNFAAYGFAPASLVAPMATTTVIGINIISWLDHILAHFWMD